MKQAIAFAFAVSCLWVSTAAAGVNCDQVNKYLKTGRTPQDVADTMVISIDEVKKCQAGTSTTAPGAAKTGSDEKGGSTAAPEGSKSH